jgi:TP901 family phage tail tape measure protein
LAGTLGTITGQVRIDVKQAIAAYAAVRAANISTLLALRSASTVFLAAGAAMAGAGLLIVAGFVKGIKAAADFERQLDFFGAVSNSTAKEMEGVRAKAIQLGKDTIFSTGQIADSFVELGKAGVSAKDIIGGVGQAVASLGAAGDIPLDQAANIITAALQTFKLGADQAVHVADLLAGAANSSVVDIDDLGVSLKYVGGVAASISIPIGDTIDAISLLGKAGIRGSTAGTSLRQILVSLTGTSKKATGVLKDLGIITKDGANQFFTAQGKAKPLSEIFQILQDKTKGLTEAQRLAAFKTIFNNRALAAANILAREGASGFAAMNKEISKTTAADVAAKRLDNLSGDVERLKSNLEVLFLNAGAPFQDFLRGIVQNITKLVSAFTDLSPKTQDIIFKVVAITGALLLFMGTLSIVIGLVLRFASNMLLMGQAIKLVTKSLAALRVGFIATWLAALGPVGLIIAAVILVIGVLVLLYIKVAFVRNAINAAGAAIVTAFWAVVNFFRGPFVSAMITAWTAVVNAFNTAKNAVVSAWNAVGAFFSTVGNAIKNGVIAAFNAVVGFFAALPGRILTFVSALVTGVISFFSQLPERVAYFIGFMIGRAIRLMIDFTLAMLRLSQAIINGVISFFQQLPGRCVAIWNAVKNGAISAWNATKNAVVSAAKAVASGVVNAITSLPGKIVALWNRIKSGAISTWNSLKSAVVSAAKAVASGVVSAITSLPGKIKSLFDKAKANAIAAWNELKSKVISIAKSLPGAVGSALSGLGSAISGAFQRALGALGNLGSQAFSKAKSIGSSLWNGFKDGLGIHSPSFIEKAMFAIHETMVDEIGFLGKMVRKAQAVGGNLRPVARTLTGVQQARAASINATSGTIAGPLDLGRETADNTAAVLESLERLIEAVQTNDGNTYLDGKKVDAAMSATAMAGGYWNTRD